MLFRSLDSGADLDQLDILLEKLIDQIVQRSSATSRALGKVRQYIWIEADGWREPQIRAVEFASLSSGKIVFVAHWIRRPLDIVGPRALLGDGRR